MYYSKAHSKDLIDIPNESPDSYRQEDAGIKRDHWPYGPNIDLGSQLLLLNWAYKHELKLSKTWCEGMHWLARGKCSVRHCETLWVTHHWYDHATRWNHKGKAALMVTQPYGVFAEDHDKLAHLCAANDLRYSVGDTGWYGHGTDFVVVWNPKVISYV